MLKAQLNILTYELTRAPARWRSNEGRATYLPCCQQQKVDVILLQENGTRELSFSSIVHNDVKACDLADAPPTLAQWTDWLVARKEYFETGHVAHSTALFALFFGGQRFFATAETPL